MRLFLKSENISKLHIKIMDASEPELETLTETQGTRRLMPASV